MGLFLYVIGFPLHRIFMDNVFFFVWGGERGKFSLLDIDQARYTCRDFRRNFIVLMDRKLLAVVKILTL